MEAAIKSESLTLITSFKDAVCLCPYRQILEYMPAFRKTCLTLMIISLIAIKHSGAQSLISNNAVWDNSVYMVKNGLPVPQLTRIYKDVSGTIWAGGQGGLFRFDGYEFTSYSAAEGLNNTWIRYITGDSSGVIYAGTLGGLAVVKNNRVSVFKLAPDSTKRVDAIQLINENEILASSRNEIWQITIDKTTWKARKLFMLPKKNMLVQDFAVDKAGRIYLSTNGGFFVYWNNKLEELDHVFSKHVEVDRFNNVWYTDRSLKKLTWTSKGPVIEAFNVYPGADTVTGPPIGGFHIHNDEVLLYPHHDASIIPGRPLVNAGYYFITRHSVTTNKQTHLKGVAPDSLGFTVGITIDNEGCYWLANAQALTRLKPLDYFETTPPEEDAKKLVGETRSYNGVKYRYGGEGLFRVVGNKSYRDKYWSMPLDQGGMGSVAIQEALIDVNGDVWLATDGYGIFRKRKTDPVDAPWINYNSQTGNIKSNVFMTAFEARNKHIYFGSSTSVTVYDGKDFFTLDSRHGYPENDAMVSMISEDVAGNILIATTLGLYSYRDGKVVNVSRELGMEAGIASWVQSSPDSTVWLGTYGQGVIQVKMINERFKLLRQVTTKDGLSDNFVQVVLPDSNGRVWTANFGGYNLITPIGARSKVTRITSKMLWEKYDPRGLLMDENGNVIGITSQGKLRLKIPPGSVVDSVVNIPVYITGFKVFNKELQPAPDNKSRLPHYLNVPENPVLDHDQNQITINFVGLYYTDPSNLKYSYVLEGASDDEWTPLSNTRSASYSHLPPGSYVFKVKADINGNSTRILEYPFTIRPPWWDTIYFRIAVLVLLITGLGAVFYYINRRRIRNAERLVKQLQMEAFHQQEIQAMEQSINENKLKLLQAQMNPHFIFNVLSSLQNYIRRGDTAQSEKLLIEFGGLIRKSLDISGQSYISIQQEISYLKEYIEVEKQRTNNKFEYNIHIDKSLAEPGNYYLPGMLLQPLVENAILHGLIPKPDGTGKLEIGMQLLAGNLLECTIKDNGPGIKETIKTHKPVAVSNVKERLSLYSKYLGKDVHFEIKSLNAGGNWSSGTEVIIQIPCFVLASTKKEQIVRLN